MLEILPGILEKDWGAIEEKILLVKPFASHIHIDLLDGTFAPNTTFFDPSPFEKYTQDTFFELHMMVENPLQYIDDWGKVGIKRFLGHIEMMPDQEAFLKKARIYGEAGLALDGPTPLSALTVPVDVLDAILIMTIQAGFSGQSFQQEHLRKVREITAQSGVPVAVDGGITDVTIKDAVQCGVKRVVSTSFLFSADDPLKQYSLLQTAIAGQ